MSNTRVTFKLDNLKQRLKKVTNDLKTDKFGQTISNVITKKIRRDSYNWKTGKSFKALAPSTIERRKKLSKYNKTHSDYSPSKSNLTFTGRLLKSVKTRIIARSKSIIFRIDVSGSHAPYKGKGKTYGKRVANKVIRDGLAKQGRDPLAINRSSKKKLGRIIAAIIQERLNK